MCVLLGPARPQAQCLLRMNLSAVKTSTELRVFVCRSHDDEADIVPLAQIKGQVHEVLVIIILTL